MIIYIYILKVRDDTTLNIKEAVFTVETIITEYTERMTFTETVWQAWQQKVSSSRQFKSQWHQFVADARKVGTTLLCVLLNYVQIF